MATNFIQDGDVIALTWSSTSPTAGDPVIKCTSKAAGGIVGVALNGIASASESISVQTRGVFDLSVAVSVAAAIGDHIYADVGGIEVCTATLGNDATGLLFGQLLEAVTATTATTVKILLCQPGGAS